VCFGCGVGKDSETRASRRALVFEKRSSGVCGGGRRQIRRLIRKATYAEVKCLLCIGEKRDSRKKRSIHVDLGGCREKDIGKLHPRNIGGTLEGRKTGEEDAWRLECQQPRESTSRKKARL